MSCPKHSTEEGHGLVRENKQPQLASAVCHKVDRVTKACKDVMQEVSSLQKHTAKRGTERCVQPANTLSASFNQGSKISSGMKLNQFSDENPLELNFC